jgi:uncharacterized membrane protein YeaQ/YmgE (transglycosylase-associated protein family)
MDQTEYTNLSKYLLLWLGIAVVLLFGSLALSFFSNATITTGALFPSMLVGMIGALISTQRRLGKLPAQQTKLMVHNWYFTLLPALIGGVLAMLFYILMMSGLVTGSLFPSFETIGCNENKFEDVGLNVGLFLDTALCEPSDYAKLFVWCFVAGYSEDMVLRFVKVLGNTKTD